MFDPSDIARLTDADRDQIAADFVAKYGISEATAARAVHLALTLSASLPAEQTAAEYEKAVTRAFTDGEAWAAEFTTALLAQALPGYRATYRAALADGLDPAAALAHEHHLGAAAIAEILTLLTGQTPTTPTPAPASASDAPASDARSFTADVTSRSGYVTVTVDPAATVPAATVRTADTSGPAADAAARATVVLDGDRLTVRVPDVAQEPFTQVTTNSRGDVTVSQYIGVVTGSITGLVIGGDSTMLTGSAPSPIEVLVTLPPRSALRLDSRNATLRVTGPLDSLRVHTRNGSTFADDSVGEARIDSSNGDVDITGPIGSLRVRTTNGSVTAGTADQVDIETHNGTVRLAAVTGTLHAESHNGYLTVDAYSGTDARLTTHNGRIALATTGRPTGRIKASTHNGPITLRGVDGRLGLKVRTSTHNGTVRTS